MTKLLRAPTSPIDAPQQFADSVPVDTATGTQLGGEQCQDDKQPIVVLLQKEQKKRQGEAARLSGFLRPSLHGEKIAVQSQQRQSGAETLKHDVGSVGAMGRAGGKKKSSDQSGQIAAARRRTPRDQESKQHSSYPSGQTRKHCQT